MDALRNEEKKSLSDLNNIMNNMGKKKSLKDVEFKYNSSRNEESKEEIMNSINIADTSKLDLSEI